MPMDLTEVLRRFGPMTTGKAAQILQERGLSAEAARQRISRRSAGVMKLQGLTFPKKARFIYLESDFGTERYWSALTDAIETSNPAYAAALNGLRARGSVCLERDFDIVSGSPSKQKGQVASAVVLERLMSALLVERFSVEGFGECVGLASHITGNVPWVGPLRARLLAEGVLLDAIRGWAGRMNMASPGVTRIRDDFPPPEFATFRFDLSGPCYLQPLIRRKPESVDPGFFCADVLLGVDLDERLVTPFLRKCTMLANLRGARPFLPMLIADNFTPEALNACRKRGVMATTPASLFGEAVARGLGELLATLTRSAGATGSQLEKLFSKLSSLEGAAGNLRGALFELVVGHCVKSLEGGTVDIGVTVMGDRGQRAEVDVKNVREKAITIYECKGHQPDSMVGLKEIESWIEKKVPTIYSALSRDDRYSGSKIQFEFWTIGGFMPDALDVLEGAQSTIRKYGIAWKDGKAIQDYARSLSAPGVVKILDEHYFKHPVTKILR